MRFHLALIALCIAGCRGGAAKSSAKELTAFSFAKDSAVHVESAATISGLSVHVFLPSGTDTSALIATFTASDKSTVSVNGVMQTSGVSINDFRNPVAYLVTAEDGSTQSYSVSVTTELPAFDEAVSAFMSKYSVPAASIAVTYNERLIYLKTYGQATTQSLFRLASVSKPITSIAIVKLMEQGKLHLGDTVFGPGGILGTTYGTQPYGLHIAEITVDELLHHTGGGWPNDGSDPMFQHPEMTAAQLISWTLDNQPLQTVPGTAYAYSNFGYCILGRVIEKVTGMSYPAAVQSLVLAPLGIDDMAIAGNTLADRLPNEVQYYGQSGEDPYSFNIARMDSHGGWLATARDLATLLVHVDGFSTKPDLLAAASIATMTTPSSAEADYACGWSVNSAHNWWHIGSLPGTESEIIRAGIGWNWVVLVNTRSTSASFATDLDNLFWTAHASLGSDLPPYDLFGD